MILDAVSRIVRLFVDTPLLNIISKLLSLVQEIPSGNVYQVLEHEGTLELLNANGEIARYIKEQKVRFLQNAITTYHDQAWGDGDIFADYRCSPGIAVDRYREGPRWRILISLRQTKNRGDIEEFHIERLIRGGFCREDEEFQTQVDHPTRKLRISVIFPADRPPKQVMLIERDAARTTPLGSEYIAELADGRQRVTWETVKPRLFEGYTLRWRW